MELREVARVVRKHWILAICGLLIAAGLAVVTYIGRTPSPYSSTTTLFVTQKGYGFSNGVNGGQLISNAYLYAQVAQGDLVRREIGAKPKSIVAGVVTSGAFGTGNPLPFVQLAAQADTAAHAEALAAAATKALQRYVAEGQAALHTPESLRAQIQVLNAPTPGKRPAARTRVVIMPAIVFLTVILLSLGAIFAIENLSTTTGSIDSRLLVDSKAGTRSRWSALPSNGESETVHSAPTATSLRRHQ